MNIDDMSGLTGVAAFSWEKSVHVTSGSSQKASVGNRADVLIRTMDGDRITLSMDSKAYADTAAGNKAAAQSASSIGLVLSRGASISVVGELNEQELMDLDRAVATIDQMYSRFLDGHGEQAIGLLEQFNGLGSIAGVDTDFVKETYAGGSIPAFVASGLEKLVQGKNEMEALLEQLIETLEDNVKDELRVPDETSPSANSPSVI